jgi:quercetin dioxygenase-like cupin family protein
MFGQSTAPASETQNPQRKEILKNSHVTVITREFAPNESEPMHHHDHAALLIFLTSGRGKNQIQGKDATVDKYAAGDVRFIPAGYTHSATSEGPGPLKIVLVEFADPQGKMVPDKGESRTCNPGTKNCVDEKYLFCTSKVCVEDVTMAPGAVSTRHGHTTDHMLVAISDYEISDAVEGKGTVKRTRKSGEVEYIPAGITHRLTNAGTQPAHFIVVLWR